MGLNLDPKTGDGSLSYTAPVGRDAARRGLRLGAPPPCITLTHRFASVRLCARIHFLND